MNKATRMLAVTGMALFAGLAFGGAPAMASPSSETTTTVKQADLNPARTVGYFPTRWACERAGERGERFGSWDDYDCYRAGFRGGYVLDVAYGWSDWNGWNDWSDHRGGHRGGWFPGGDHHRWGGWDHRDGGRGDGDGPRGGGDGPRGGGDGPRGGGGDGPRGGGDGPRGGGDGPRGGGGDGPRGGGPRQP